MAQAETMMANHVAICIVDKDGANSSSCCAVCMEPLEWVIVGACGHREVCIYCGVRMRFFQDDRRCCICRAFCATVVITRANSGPQQSVVSETLPEFDSTVKPARTYCRYYHGGMAAYFDDRAPYEAVRLMCSPPLPLPPTGVGIKHQRAPEDPNEDSLCFLQYLAVMALVGAAGSIPLVMHYLKDWLPRVAVVIGSGLLTTAWSYFHSKRYS